MLSSPAFCGMSGNLLTNLPPEKLRTVIYRFENYPAISNALVASEACRVCASNRVAFVEWQNAELKKARGLAPAWAFCGGVILGAAFTILTGWAWGQAH